jgi:hypothetical protein
VLKAKVLNSNLIDGNYAFEKSVFEADIEEFSSSSILITIVLFGHYYLYKKV